jgi:parallel beta-helix repeat protein
MKINITVSICFVRNTLMFPSMLSTLKHITLLLVITGFISMAHAQNSPLPPEMTAWDANTKQAQRDAGTKMLAEIEAAVARGEKNIVIPKGHYRFKKLIEDRYSKHILWENMQGVTLDFQGSTFWFENPQTGIYLTHNSDCTLKNLYMDWDPLPFVQGRIMAIDHDKQQLHVKLDAGYDQSADAPLTQNPKARWRGMIFNAQTRKLKPQVIGFSLYNDWTQRTPEGYQITKFSGFYGTKLKESGIQVGDDIAMVRRIGRAVRIEFCHNNTLENVTLYASPFVCFVQKLGTGTATFRKVNILRRPNTNRLIAGNADGINVNNMENGPLLDDCHLEYLGDDFVNVHSAYSRTVWQNADNQLVSTPINSNAAMQANNGKPVKITFFDRKTMTVIGERNIIKVTNIAKHPIEQDKCLFDLKNYFHSGEAGQFKEGNKTAQANLLTLDKPITIDSDVITTCPQFISSGAIIRNCNFVGTIARGIRLQAPNALIENNHIENVRSFGLSMSGQPQFWGEGPYVHSTIARNNTFIDCANGPSDNNQPVIMIKQQGDYATDTTQYDITLENNTIQNCGAMGIEVRGVKGITLTGNTITGYSIYPNLSKDESIPADINGTGYGIVVESCENVTLKNNSVSQPGPFAKGEIFQARNR